MDKQRWPNVGCAVQGSCRVKAKINGSLNITKHYNDICSKLKQKKY